MKEERVKQSSFILTLGSFLKKQVDSVGSVRLSVLLELLHLQKVSLPQLNKSQHQRPLLRMAWSQRMLKMKYLTVLLRKKLSPRLLSATGARSACPTLLLAPNAML